MFNDHKKRVSTSARPLPVTLGFRHGACFPPSSLGCPDTGPWPEWPGGRAAVLLLLFCRMAPAVPSPMTGNHAGGRGIGWVASRRRHPRPPQPWPHQEVAPTRQES